MAEADGSEIVVSAALREALADGARFTDLGEHQLKGVPGSWRVYRLVEGPKASGPATSAR